MVRNDTRGGGAKGKVEKIKRRKKASTTGLKGVVTPYQNPVKRPWKIGHKRQNPIWKEQSRRPVIEEEALWGIKGSSQGTKHDIVPCCCGQKEQKATAHNKNGYEKRMALWQDVQNGSRGGGGRRESLRSSKKTPNSKERSGVMIELRKSWKRFVSEVEQGKRGWMSYHQEKRGKV